MKNKSIMCCICKDTKDMIQEGDLTYKDKRGIMHGLCALTHPLHRFPTNEK